MIGLIIFAIAILQLLNKLHENGVSFWKFIPITIIVLPIYFAISIAATLLTVDVFSLADSVYGSYVGTAWSIIFYISSYFTISKLSYVKFKK